MLKKLKKHLFPIVKVFFDKYVSKQHKFTFQGITISTHEDVFPPRFTISTKILLNYIQPLDVKDKSFLELGCGSGIISLFAAKKGANVTATDINKTALNLLEQSSKINNIKLKIIYSDLFENISKPFEYIIINPPYYPKNPKNIKEKAWFCGENFEYFKRLFKQLPEHLAPNTWMILSEDCDIEQIKKLARKHVLSFDLIFEKTIFKEKNYVFNIKNLNNN